MTRGPAKPMRAFGSAMVMSPSMAKLASTPPVVGSVSTAMKRLPASEWRLTAPVVLAICISDRMPSCMRAPPEAQKPTTGRPFSRACSNRRVIFSPTAVPMEAIMNDGSMKKTQARSPPIIHSPVTTASTSPDCSRAWASFFS